MPPDDDPDAGDLWLFELAPRLTRLENAVLRNVSPPMTFRQYRILRRVAEGHQTLTDIGGQGTLSLAAISESVDALVRKRVLRRRTDPRDRRSTHLLLTPAGNEALEASHKLLNELAAHIYEGMPEGRRELLKGDLEFVNKRVTELLRSGGKVE